jgi:hypothetical protein
MLGAGKYSSHWGFTGDLATVAHHIPSCVACVWQNKQFIPSNNHCQQCTNWETFGHHHLLQTPIPKKYSSEFATEEELYLTPKKLTYDMLKVGVMSSHANYVHSQWVIDTVKQFLYSLSINNEAIQGFLNHAQNAHIGNKNQYLEITINGSKKSTMGLHYWNADIDITSNTHAGPDKECSIKHHYLLLPQLTKKWTSRTMVRALLCHH